VTKVGQDGDKLKGGRKLLRGGFLQSGAKTARIKKDEASLIKAGQTEGYGQKRWVSEEVDSESRLKSTGKPFIAHLTKKMPEYSK